MKRILYLIPVALALLIAVSACNDNKTEKLWEEYAAIREANEKYYDEQAELLGTDGKPFYDRIVPSWDLGSEILIHYFNDRSKTVGNLTPMLTSRCAVSYIGRNAQGVAFDSSYTATSRVRIFTPQQTISGWWIALENMRVGDSVRVVLPYGVAYGSTGSPSGAIGPFETLTFDMKLEDIIDYEIK